MVKLKVSYREQEEIEKVLELLCCSILSVNVSKDEKENCMKAYIEIDI